MLLALSFTIACALVGHLPLTFRTPPVSPPRTSYIAGMRRVCSLEFRPHLMTSPDTGLANPLLGSGGATGTFDRSLLPQSNIYNWSCGHFSKPLLTAADDSEEVLAKREEREKFALEHIVKCQHSGLYFTFSKSINQIPHSCPVENFISFYSVSC